MFVGDIEAMEVMLLDDRLFLDAISSDPDGDGPRLVYAVSMRLTPLSNPVPTVST